MIKLAAGLLASAPVASRADVIVQNTKSSLGTVAAYVGESFTTPSDFLYYNLSFNFYANLAATTPTAGGTAFILNQPYTGTPAGLSVTTPGFLAESLGTASVASTFNPGFILTTGTTYYLYENALITTSGGNAFPGGNAYFANGSATNFATFAAPAGGLQAANFSLNGTQVGVPLVPEPSTWALSALGMVGLGAMAWRRRQAQV